MWLLYSLSLVSLALAGDTRRQVLQLEPKAPVPVVLPAVVDPKPPSLPLPVGPKAPVPQVLPIEPKAPLPQILPFDPKALVPQVEPHPPQPLLPFIERPSGPIVPFIEPPADKKGIVIDVNYDNDSEEGPRPPKHGGKHRKHSSSSSSSSSSSESEEEVISRPCPVHGGHKDGKHGKHGKKHGHGPHRPPPPFHGPHGHGPHGRQPGCTCGLPPAPSTVPPTPEATSTVAPTQPPKPCTIVDALHVCDPFRLAVANNTGPLSSCPLVEHDFLLRQFEFCIANYCGAQKEEVCANIREVTKACWIAEDQPVNREDWVAQAGCQLAVPSTGAPTTPAPPTVAPSTHKPKKHGHGKKQPKEEKKEDAPSWWGKWKKKWGEFIKRKEN